MAMLIVIETKSEVPTIEHTVHRTFADIDSGHLDGIHLMEICSNIGLCLFGNTRLGRVRYWLAVFYKNLFARRKGQSQFYV